MGIQMVVAVTGIGWIVPLLSRLNDTGVGAPGGVWLQPFVNT